MQETFEFEIKTTIVDGDFDSFKAAIGRSLIGVTLKKGKRRIGDRIYRSKSRNLAVVEQIATKLYEQLQAKLGSTLKYLRLRTILTVQWDKDGQIIGVSNVRISVYQPVGELSIDAANITAMSQKVKIDVFYSSVDYASQKVRDELDLLAQNVPPILIVRTDHDFLDPKNREMAAKFDVKLVPAVVLNETEILSGPSKSLLKEKIQQYLAPAVNLTEARFEYEATLSIIPSELAKIQKQ